MLWLWSVLCSSAGLQWSLTDKFQQLVRKKMHTPLMRYMCVCAFFSDWGGEAAAAYRGALLLIYTNSTVSALESFQFSECYWLLERANHSALHWLLSYSLCLSPCVCVRACVRASHISVQEYICSDCLHAWTQMWDGNIQQGGKDGIKTCDTW